MSLLNPLLQTATATAAPVPRPRHSLWKHEACINKDVPVIDSYKHAVHADLSKATNGEDPEGRPLGIWWSRKRAVGYLIEYRAQMLPSIAGLKVLFDFPFQRIYGKDT